MRYVILVIKEFKIRAMSLTFSVPGDSEKFQFNSLSQGDVCIYTKMMACRVFGA